MNDTSFDTMTVRFGTGMSRRTLAKIGAAAALVAAFRGSRLAAAQNCHAGPRTCKSGFVWREASQYDLVCVTPDVRDQAAYDNAQAPYRVDPYGPYGPNTCVSGYVWREAFPGDVVCVEPWVRDQVAYDNSVQNSRIEPGCNHLID